jgi:hypothetical protein
MQFAFLAIAKCLILISAANIAPAALKLVLNNRYSSPIEGVQHGVTAADFLALPRPGGD